MNKLVFSLLLALLFASCQNTPKSASENTQAPAAPVAPTAPGPASPEEVQQASVNVSSGLKTMEDIRKQVDALPASVKKEKAAEIEALYSNLEGMMAKQSKMLEVINASSGPTSKAEVSQETGGPDPVNAAQLEEYKVSLAEYAKEAQAMQEAVAKLAASAKK